MSTSFDPKQGLVIVHAELTGPSGIAILRLALDTGATGTLINAAPLVALGYQPGLATTQVQVTTGSGVEFVPRIAVIQISALEHKRDSFPSSVTRCRQVRLWMVSLAWTFFAVTIWQLTLPRGQ
jgi:hypothetical protein